MQWTPTDNEGRFVAGGFPVGARCDVFAIHPVGGGRSRRKSFEVKNTGPQYLWAMLSFIRAECLATFQLHFRKKLAEFCPIAALSVSIRTGRGFLEDHGKA